VSPVLEVMDSSRPNELIHFLYEQGDAAYLQLILNLCDGSKHASRLRQTLLCLYMITYFVFLHRVLLAALLLLYCIELSDTVHFFVYLVRDVRLVFHLRTRIRFLKARERREK